MSTIDTLVYGERASNLLAALHAIGHAMTLDDDGMFVFEGELEPAIGQPFRRALMRAEAELLLEEADTPVGPEFEDRTPEQRGADALIRLAEAVFATF